MIFLFTLFYCTSCKKFVQKELQMINLYQLQLIDFNLSLLINFVASPCSPLVVKTQTFFDLTIFPIKNHFLILGIELMAYTRWVTFNFACRTQKST